MSSSQEGVGEMMRTLASMGLLPSDLQRVLSNIVPSAPMPRHPSSSSGATNPRNVEQEIDEVRAAWERENGLPYVKPVLQSRRTLLENNMSMRETMDEKVGRDYRPRLTMTTVGHKKHYSSTPISKLSRVTLKDMFARKVHKAQYLLCRTIGKPSRPLSVDLIVEDPDGDAALMSLYNFPGLHQASLGALDAQFPIGLILAIREPYFKVPNNGYDAFIRVDSPSDIILVNPPDPLARGVVWRSIQKAATSFSDDPERCKALGTKNFKEGYLIPAALAWTRGIKADPSMCALWLNRSQAYIRLGWFSAALKDAIHVLALPDLPVAMASKASYRAGCAQFGLGRYTEALKLFQGVQEDMEMWMARCQRRLKEATTGDYDWIQMFDAGQKAVPDVDVAEFVGPVEIYSVPHRGGGRGMRATRDILNGELLIVAKPFAKVFPEELSKLEIVHGLNFTTRRKETASRVALISRVISTLHGCPEMIGKVYGLYSGPSFPSPPVNYPLADHSLRTLSEPLHHEVDIDTERIDGVVAFNVFTIRSVKEIPSGSFATETDDQNAPSALYTLPSMFNHSCDPNGGWACFGDVMVIRATRGISKGTEITLAYTDGPTHVSRNKILTAYFVKPCDCGLCEEERADGDAACSKREELLKGWYDRERMSGQTWATVLPGNKTIVESHLQQLASTFTPSLHLRIRPALFNAHLEAVSFFQRAGDGRMQPELWRRAIEHAFMALEAAGFKDLDKSLSRGTSNGRSLPLSTERRGTCMVDPNCYVVVMLSISQSFLLLKESTRAERWYRAAWWVHEVTWGGGRALFDRRTKDIIGAISFPQSFFLNIAYGWD